MATTEKHYAVFYSPGTFVCEESSRPVSEWSTRQAVAAAETIRERYNAKPFGFRFRTHLESPPIPDGRGGTMDVEPKPLKESGLHWLGGTLLLYDDVPDDKEHSILRSNMLCNDMPVVIEKRNSFRYTGQFGPDDVICGPSGEIVRRGDDSELKEYREKFKAMREAYYADLAKGAN